MGLFVFDWLKSLKSNGFRSSKEDERKRRTAYPEMKTFKSNGSSSRVTFFNVMLTDV